MLLYEKILSPGHVWAARINEIPKTPLASIFKVVLIGVAIAAAPFVVGPALTAVTTKAWSVITAPREIVVPRIKTSNIANLVAGASAGDPAIAELRDVVGSVGQAQIDGLLSNKPEAMYAAMPAIGQPWPADRLVFRVAGADVLLGAKVIVYGQSRIWLGAAHKLKDKWSLYNITDESGQPIADPRLSSLALRTAPRFAEAAGLAVLMNKDEIRNQNSKEN